MLMFITSLQGITSRKGQLIAQTCENLKLYDTLIWKVLLSVEYLTVILDAVLAALFFEYEKGARREQQLT